MTRVRDVEVTYGGAHGLESGRLSRLDSGKLREISLVPFCAVHLPHVAEPDLCTLKPSSHTSNCKYNEESLTTEWPTIQQIIHSSSSPRFGCFRRCCKRSARLLAVTSGMGLKKVEHTVPGAAPDSMMNRPPLHETQ